MIIDFHTHIFSPRIRNDRQKYLDADQCFATLYSHKDSKLATADELIDSMDEHGIDISVVLNIGWTTHRLCVETNDYIMESIARYPGRLIGFCSVQPAEPSSAVGEIERCVQGGIKGIGELRPDTQPFSLDDEKIMRPFADSVIENHLPVLTHASEPVGHDYSGKGAITPEVLYPFITRYPEITLILAHWGGGMPFYSLMPEVNRALANVYYDTAATPYLYSPRIYGEVARLVGEEKILFGSDYPLMSPKRLIDDIRSRDLPQETSDLILSGNARRLLNI